MRQSGRCCRGGHAVLHDPGFRTVCIRQQVTTERDKVQTYHCCRPESNRSPARFISRTAFAILLSQVSTPSYLPRPAGVGGLIKPPSLRDFFTKFSPNTLTGLKFRPTVAFFEVRPKIGRESQEVLWHKADQASSKSLPTPDAAARLISTLAKIFYSRLNLVLPSLSSRSRRID